MIDYTTQMFHVGHLVPNLEQAMDQLGTDFGFEWTQVVLR